MDSFGLEANCKEVRRDWVDGPGLRLLTPFPHLQRLCLESVGHIANRQIMEGDQ